MYKLCQYRSNLANSGNDLVNIATFSHALAKLNMINGGVIIRP